MPTSRKIVFYVVAGIFLLLIGLSFCKRAEAAACGQTEGVLAMLHDHGQVPAFIANSAAGSVLTITVNPETGAWTAILQPKADVMCIVDAGTGWEAAPESLKGDPV